jgi:hypothetical protein
MQLFCGMAMGVRARPTLTSVVHRVNDTLRGAVAAVDALVPVVLVQARRLHLGRGERQRAAAFELVGGGGRLREGTDLAGARYQSGRPVRAA